MADTRTALALWFERSGFTQREKAAQLGVTEQHMSHLVSGSRTPSLALAVRISEMTGIPIVELARGRSAKAVA